MVVGADRGEAWANVKNEVVLLEKTRPLRAHKRKNHSAISALKLPFDPVCGTQIEKKTINKSSMIRSSCFVDIYFSVQRKVLYIYSPHHALYADLCQTERQKNRESGSTAKVAAVDTIHSIFL